jgi:hypothetical protein
LEKSWNVGRCKSEVFESLFLEIIPKFEPPLYFDVGAGLDYNSLALGENTSEILAVDLRFP